MRLSFAFLTMFFSNDLVKQFVFEFEDNIPVLADKTNYYYRCSGATTIITPS